MIQTLYSSEPGKASIFVVDDEPANLRLIERLLQSDGFEDIHSIQNPEEVVARFQARRPNLILLDINMPRLDGFAVLEKLKELGSGTLPPIVFLTAQSTSEYRVKAYENGVLDFICKPFNRLELISRVKNLLALDNAHRALADRNSTLEETVHLRTEALRRTQLQVVQKLGRAAEYRDNETGAHILRMSNIAALLAHHLGLPDDHVQDILHASPLHDVGKIAIPDNILLKAGTLAPDEWEIMKTHTTLGYEILSGADSRLLDLASEIALHHHEKWDGSGYPDGLAHEAIPLSCRIVAVADVFDALVSQRPYKLPWKQEEAQAYLNDQKGRHFDPAVIDVFNSLIDEIMAIRNRYQDSPQHQPVGNTGASRS